MKDYNLIDTREVIKEAAEEKQYYLDDALNIIWLDKVYNEKPCVLTEEEFLENQPDKKIDDLKKIHWNGSYWINDIKASDKIDPNSYVMVIKHVIDEGKYKIDNQIDMVAFYKFIKGLVNGEF